ncbi:MAG: outer membrane lipoprotein carrier protein LolA [Lactobacillales bacterium]|jgi:outer membrane lipoprotein-sorting protein|nr:outer membrane lipoprotein carrier protein LolA [Lactobacillales bacterium]
MKKIVLFLFLFLAVVPPVLADVSPKVDTPRNRAILSQVEKAYNKIKTLKAKFAQFNSKMTDELHTGALYLSRPGKMRLVYEKGSPLEFYAFDGYLVYHDKDLKEVSYFDLEQTPVSLILKKELKFDDPEFLVTDVKDVLDEYFVTAEKKGAAELGSLTLVIDKETLELKQWDVLDMQGVKSTVSLFDIEQNVPIDKSLFLFQNPYKKK